MQSNYSQRIIPDHADRDSWPEWADPRHLLERLRPYFLLAVLRVGNETWAKSWSISKAKQTLTLKCAHLSAEQQKQARLVVDQINASIHRFRVPCPIKIRTDAPELALGLFELMG